jgi:hypothetical protein
LEDPADLGSPLSRAVEVLAVEDDQHLASAAGGLVLAALGPRLLEARHLLSVLERQFENRGGRSGAHCSKVDLGLGRDLSKQHLPAERHAHEMSWAVAKLCARRRARWLSSRLMKT